ncbi:MULTISPECIES: hypothetical protein [Pseudoalteromonas]|uniref:DUF3450 domain-containing protein n=1 Tax=Pseudoalteromonas amylolytica TaxID=1859457 RepID=A0A1S1MWM5_9GAMM|nr:MULTISPECIES: hypothetical protein [Pseudoalteromonas]OHU88037.1 hypothetical protein BFC16_11625 [Pseudoalteromonas sp. JW3]OHU91477.1 hypothetical protein BET10_11745 [Pseudoalteromonas amylolytica]
MCKPLLLLTLLFSFKALSLPKHSELVQLSNLLNNKLTQSIQDSRVKLDDIHTLYAPAQGVHIAFEFKIDDDETPAPHIAHSFSQNDEFVALKQQLRVLSHQIFSLEKQQAMISDKASADQITKLKQELAQANQQKTELAEQYNALTNKLSRQYQRAQLITTVEQIAANVLCSETKFDLMASLDKPFDESVAVTLNSWPDSKDEQPQSLVWVFSTKAIEQCQSSSLSSEQFLQQKVQVQL